MKRPTEQQINIAIGWLDANEGEGDEAQACKAVAEWINAIANDAMLREEARRAGVTVAALRRRLSNFSALSKVEP
jgi:rRNA-processing protein FCF1